MELYSEIINQLSLPGDGQWLSHCESHLLVSLKATKYSPGPSPCSSPSQNGLLRLRLFWLSMPANGNLVARVSCQRTESSKTTGIVGIYTAYSVPSNDAFLYHDTEIRFDKENWNFNIPIRIPPTIDSEGPPPVGNLVEIGIFCAGMPEFTSRPMLELLHVYHLQIGPQRERPMQITIRNIAVVKRQSGMNSERRLAWDWACVPNAPPVGRPWSRTTGPFSHFDVTLDGIRIGEAFCLEFPVRRDDLDDALGVDGVEVLITGYLFGGGVVTGEARVLRTDLIFAESRFSYG